MDTSRVLPFERHHLNVLLLVGGFDLGFLERMADANLGALNDDVRLLPAAQGRARADVGAAHVGAPDAAPAADQHDSDHYDCYCGQGEQGGSSPVRGNMEFFFYIFQSITTAQ